MSKIRNINASLYGAMAFLHSATLSYAADGHGAAPLDDLQGVTADHAATAGEAAHHSSGGLPQLDPSTFETQLIWLFIVFTFMYMFFSKKSLPEIRTVIENRHERIQNDLDTAERLRSDAETVRKAYEDGIHKAQTQASEIFNNVEEAIRTKAESQLKAFAEKSASQLEKSESEIDKVRKNALKEIEASIGDLAKKAAEKILEPKTSTAKAA